MNELLIKNGMVYSYIFEGYHAIKLQRADIYIDDGCIKEIKPGIEKGCDMLDATGCIVLPGMVNMCANTFTARITSGLLCDRRAGLKQVGPMLELAAEILDADEIRAIAMSGLWETVSSGATAVAERYPAAAGALAPGMSRAAAELGIQLLTIGKDVDDAIIAESAVSCAHLGKPYDGLERILSGVNMTIGTGYFDSCMISEMRAVACSVKQHTKDAGAYRASDAFYSATVVNGRVFDAERYGRIGQGFNGDVSVVCMDRFAPLSYPLAQYVYGANAGDVRHVVCGGVALKRDYKPADYLSEPLAQAREKTETAICRLWGEARRSIL